MPPATVEPTVMDIVEFPVPVTEEGLKPMVTPVGSPDAVKLIAELNPPVTEVEIVVEPVFPWLIETDDGEALIVKLGVVTVTVTVVDAVVAPEVPVTVMV